MAVGVAVPNAAVLAVDQELGALIPGDRAGLRDGRRLRVVHGHGALSARAADRPPALMRHNVLISFGHWDLCLKKTIAGVFLQRRRLFRGWVPDRQIPKFFCPDLPAEEP